MSHFLKICGELSNYGVFINVICLLLNFALELLGETNHTVFGGYSILILCLLKANKKVCMSCGEPNKQIEVLILQNNRAAESILDIKCKQSQYEYLIHLILYLDQSIFGILTVFAYAIVITLSTIR